MPLRISTPAMRSLAVLLPALCLAAACTAAPEAQDPNDAAQSPKDGETVLTPTQAAQPDQPTPLADNPKADPVIKSLPHIEINRKLKTVAVDAFISPRMETLELFACGNGIREHEAVVSIKARPRDVNVALILLGQAPGHPAVWTADGEFLPPYGPVFRVFVEYLKDGKTLRAEAHEWLKDTVTDKPAKPMTWVFCGGVTRKGHFIPDYEGTVVCLANFAAPILDVPFESSDKNAELLFTARAEAVPPVGTPVRLILQATGKMVVGKKLLWAFVIDKDGSMRLEGKPSSFDDLDRKLKDRDKYLQKVQIFIHPEGPGGRIIDAIGVITKYGLEVELYKKLPVDDTAPPKDPTEPENPTTKPPPSP